MEQFKVDNFKNENPSGEFPSFETLHAEKATEILNELVAKLSLRLDGKKLVRFFYENSKLLPEVNAESDGFNLIEILDRLGIVYENSVFINWDNFIHIDRIELSQLSEHFSDIWYPAADDIDIFDKSFTWVLSVFHDGRVGLVNLPVV